MYSKYTLKSVRIYAAVIVVASAMQLWSKICGWLVVTMR